MAFPVVEATNETAVVSSSSHVINLPSGIVSGDLLLIVANAGTVVISFNALAGWTELLDEGVANGMVVWARQADGTEGSTVTFTSSASGRSASIAYRISGAALLATQAPELSTVATGSSVSPNATTCTPTGGAKDYLWISFFGRGGEELDDDTWTSAAPANYTNLLQKACGTAGSNQGGMVAAAQRNLNAASEDAGAFTVATGAWRAYTLAVHPSSATTTNQALTATVTTTASVVNQVNKVMSATATTTATIAALKVIVKALTATVTNTASITKLTNKALVATTVTTTATIRRQVNKLLSATVTSSATLQAQKVILKALTATVTSTATMSRVILKPLSATVTTTASLVKRVNKNLTAGTITTTASVLAQKVILKALTATVTSTATMVRRVNKAVDATVTITASITKLVTKGLTATVTTLASIVADFVSGAAAVITTRFFARPSPSGGSGSGSPGSGHFDDPTPGQEP